MTACLGGNERLCEALIPKFPLGTRRITPAPGYLESLRAPNVELLHNNISRIVPDGIQLKSGEAVKLDAIICATGFDNSFCPRFPVVGRSGNLQDRLRTHAPKAYMSCALPGVPNYFSEWFSPACLDSIAKTSLLTRLSSFPWPERACRAWEYFHSERAHRQVHHQGHCEMSAGGHQGHCAF